MVLLVVLILEDDESQSDVARTDDEGDARDSDQRELPTIDETCEAKDGQSGEGKQEICEFGAAYR